MFVPYIRIDYQLPLVSCSQKVYATTTAVPYLADDPFVEVREPILLAPLYNLAYFQFAVNGVMFVLCETKGAGRGICWDSLGDSRAKSEGQGFLRVPSSPLAPFRHIVRMYAPIIRTAE